MINEYGVLDPTVLEHIALASWGLRRCVQRLAGTGRYESDQLDSKLADKHRPVHVKCVSGRLEVLYKDWSSMTLYKSLSGVRVSSHTSCLFFFQLNPMIGGKAWRRVEISIFSSTPNKISDIVRSEMDATGAQECLLPQLQPAALWQESGRWDTYTKAEGIMFTLGDRRKQELALGPTHEEIITAVARDTIRSYKQLPLHLYQIQTKFRDEIRPRFGLMRGREFIMKDGYSFHADTESLKQTYDEMYQAYSNILRRTGLAFRAVDADSGAIGGSGSTASLWCLQKPVKMRCCTPKTVSMQPM